MQHRNEQDGFEVSPRIREAAIWLKGIPSAVQERHRKLAVRRQRAAGLAVLAEELGAMTCASIPLASWHHLAQVLKGHYESLQHLNPNAPPTFEEVNEAVQRYVRYGLAQQGDFFEYSAVWKTEDGWRLSTPSSTIYRMTATGFEVDAQRCSLTLREVLGKVPGIEFGRVLLDLNGVEQATGKIIQATAWKDPEAARTRAEVKRLEAIAQDVVQLDLWLMANDRADLVRTANPAQDDFGFGSEAIWLENQRQSVIQGAIRKAAYAARDAREAAETRLAMQYAGEAPWW